MAKKLIQFDWAIKRLLRDKANFMILEGFMSEILKFDVLIKDIIDSESNQEAADDKFNRVDILVKTKSGELVLVEIQNDPEIDYFQRMVYGTSKLGVEHIKLGQAYGTIKKVYSINIVYFDLGQGPDYIYRGEVNFIGDHHQDRLKPSNTQRKRYDIESVSDLFPRYIILKINNFNDISKTTLDQWIYFLKNSEVKDNFRAKGLSAAKDKLEVSALGDSERAVYQRYMENRMIENSVKETAQIEGMIEGIKKGIEKGRAEGIEKSRAESVLGLYKNGISIPTISKSLNISERRVQEIVKMNSSDS